VTNSILTDPLGSTVATTTPVATPAIRDSFTYDPYGTPSSSAFPYLFTGRDYDSAAGLQYNRARYYSPPFGRFVSEDPIGIFGGSANGYLYASDAPTVLSDPSGLCSPTALSGSTLTLLGSTPTPVMGPTPPSAPCPQSDPANVLLGGLGVGLVFAGVAWTVGWAYLSWQAGMMLGLAFVPGLNVVIGVAFIVGLILGAWFAVENARHCYPAQPQGYS
jgi:RHS repeat-associated protein